MVRGLDEVKKKKSALMKDKKYISEVCLQVGKAIGNIFSIKKSKK